MTKALRNIIQSLIGKVVLTAFSIIFSTLCYAQQHDSIKGQVPNIIVSDFINGEAAEMWQDTYAAKLDSMNIMATVAEQTGARKADMEIFSNYYYDKITNDRNAFFMAIGKTIITDSDIREYAQQKIDEYVKMYKTFLQIKKDYPSSVVEYGYPHINDKPTGVCNPTCSDIGFESGTLTGWYAYAAANNSTTTTMTYTGAVGGACGGVTKAAWDNNINPYKKDSNYQVVITKGAGFDAIAGGLIPVVAPGGGTYSCRLGDSSQGGGRVAIIEQTFTATAGFTALNYMYAVIIDQAPHTFGQQPHFLVTITDQTTGDTLACGKYLVISSSGMKGYTAFWYKVPSYGWYDSIYCAPWQSVYVSLQNYIGHCIKIQALVSDCFPTKPGPHFCYVYFDATCGPHSIVTSTPSTCGGNVTMTAPGGGTYSWGGPGIVGSSTTQTITASSSGTYTVTVTSPDGCSDTLQKKITIAPTMTVTTTSTNAGCATKGSGTVNATGGTAPYTYKWSNGSTNQTDTGLVAGTYTCIVNSAGGCTDTVKITITGGGSISATNTSTNVKCNGGNTGTGSVTASGGTPPYTYSWSSGQTSSNITGLTAGSYTCTIKDAGGCTTTQTITITQPTAIAPTTSFTGTLCGASTGSATVSATGGTPGYTYVWSTAQTTTTINNLSAGTYSVTIKDANGCIATANVSIPSTNGPRDSIVSSVNVTCFGGNNGSAVDGVKGGTSPYTYAWSTSPVQTSATATSLTAGTYTVNVTDATGCLATTSVTITEPPQLRDSITASANIICNGGNNGNASVGLTGGSPGYTYSWNTAPAQTSTAAINLTAGAYTVTIVDSHGCKDSATVNITQPPPIKLSTTTFPATCANICNGQATVIPSGGTNPYTYTWSNGGTSANISNMCVDSTYTVTVTDAHGCKHDTAVSIATPTPIVITKTSAAAYCNNANGSASINATGGTPGYTYLWSTGGTLNVITNVAPGNYCVTVTDNNGCIDTACVVVPNIPGEKATIVTETNVSCNGGSNGSATANVAGGTTPYTYSWSPGGGTTLTITGLTAGLYTITATDSSGCKDTAIATITQPTPVAVTAPGQMICIGQSATLTATASGGTPGYTYLWNGTTTGAGYTVSPVKTTSYTIIVTDANGCPSAPLTVTVVVRNPLVVVTGPPASLCPGDSVKLTATGSGGDSIYTYAWMPGGKTGQTITVAPSVNTTYTVILTDACGTPQAVDSVKVIIYPLPVVNFKADTIAGCYPLCVNFTDLSTLSSGTITGWTWNFGDGDTSHRKDPHYCYKNPGVYTISLSVTTSNGCNGSKTIPNMIIVYDHPHAAFTYSPQPTNILNPTVSFTDLSTDLYGIDSWYWTFGDQSDSVSLVKDPVHTYADTGYYCPKLIVTNIHGCKDSTVNCLEIEPFFVIYVPNAFTPNGDGKNEGFIAKGVGIKTFEMWIYDRWGMQLYHCTDINAPWNGTVQNSSGQICQEDTYVWLIEVTDVFNKNHRYIGRVTLIK